jgi:hypothetical protein
MNNMGPATQKIHHPTRLIFTGRSTLGKTTLAVDVILHALIRDVKQVFAACPTFWEQKQLSRLRRIPNCFTKHNVFTRVDDTVFERIYKTLVKQGKRIPTLLFVDDAAAERATNSGNKGSFSRLCLAAPHLNLTIIGVFQRLSSASPALRDNAEGLVSFMPNKLHDVKTIVEEFNPSPANPKSKEIVQKALTYCWNDARFAFIFRPNFVGGVQYHAGFEKQVVFDKYG